MKEKLVRDRIPEIINVSPQDIRIAEPWERPALLRAKLAEEAGELFAAKTLGQQLEELADVCDVVDALVRHYDVYDDESGAGARIVARYRKLAEKGGFNKFYVLKTGLLQPWPQPSPQEGTAKNLDLVPGSFSCQCGNVLGPTAIMCTVCGKVVDPMPGGWF